MGEKKKSKNKQNFVPIKRLTLQQINYTEQLQLPTYNTIELKNPNKSIELKKHHSFKKPASRKSRCISVKQTCTSVKQSTTGSIKLKQLFKRFDELKGLQQRVQRSKSKSVKQIRQLHKSKSPVSHSKIKQTNCKKFNLNTLMNKTLNRTQNVKTQFNSRMSLTNKLQHTLKKINENDYFYRDQDDSLIPFISTSDACNNEDGNDEKMYEISSQEFMDEDFINIGEMRNFCRTKENQELFETVLKKNINYFRGDQYQMMATKIQRAWRRFRTKKLVDRYAEVFSLQKLQNLHPSPQSSDQFNMNDSMTDLRYENVYRIVNELNIDLKGKRMGENDDEENEELQLPAPEGLEKAQSYEEENNSEEKNQADGESQNQHANNESIFYKNAEQDQHLVTYISNFDEEESNSKSQEKLHFQPEFPQTNNLSQNYPLNKEPSIENSSCDLLISQIKQMELQKWKEVIELLQESKKKKSPSELQSILTKLQKTSEKNKKELEQIQKEQLLSSSNRRPSEQKNFEEKPIIKRQESGPSETSDFKKEEEFDSRKYIEYLDSDMFMVNKENSSENSELINDERLGRKISKKKQKQLLAFFDIGQAPIRLRSHCFSKSENLSYLMEDTAPYVVPVSHRLNKSISEKNIEKVIKSLSPQLEYSKEDSDTDQMNLDLIRQEFLENADPVQELQKLHTGQELRMKIKESLKQDDQNEFKDSSSDDQPVHPARISIDLSKTFQIQNESKDDYHKISEYLHGGSLNISREQKKQESPKQFTLSHSNPSKNLIIVENIDKDIQEEDEEKINQQNEEENQKAENVAFMIYSTMILEVLREIATYDSILEKFKDYSLSVKNQAQKQAKKGFQTNHTEVKSYVQGLINFLLNEEPQVFKNLQIPAGPTALEMLHYMHPNEYEDEMDDHSNISQDETSVMVIPNRMFDKYWAEREKTLKYDIENAAHLSHQRKKKIVDELKNLTKMFYRSIFDTFNQCLDIERNYGQAGKPYPWKKNASFHHTKTLSEIQKSIEASQKRMAQIATTYCGLIIQKNEMARIAIEGSDDYIQHVQEDRMSRMLAQDLIEGEERWTFYDDEELELLVEIGNFITISLVLEAGEEISSLINEDFR